MRPRVVKEQNTRNNDNIKSTDNCGNNYTLSTSETAPEDPKKIISSDSSDSEGDFVVLRRSRMNRRQRRVKKHSGYYYFMIDAHCQIKETDPHISFVDRCHLINQMWREIDDSERRSYDEIAQQIYIRSLSDSYGVKGKFI